MDWVRGMVWREEVWEEGRLERMPRRRWRGKVRVRPRTIIFGVVSLGRGGRGRRDLAGYLRKMVRRPRCWIRMKEKRVPRKPSAVRPMDMGKAWSEDRPATGYWVSG